MTDLAGSQSPDALAEQMTIAENNKFRLFSFVNELNAELETLDSQISLLQQELQSTAESTATKQEKSHLIHQVELLSRITQLANQPCTSPHLFLNLEA